MLDKTMGSNVVAAEEVPASVSTGAGVVAGDAALIELEGLRLKDLSGGAFCCSC